MIRKILIGLVVIIAVFIGVVATRPSDFQISRTVSINAPPAVVFAQLNDLHKWQTWSPWAKLDPACKVTFEGPESGVGAIFAWSGNSEVGEGRMTITESRPNDMVRFKLEFKKPFEGTNDAWFTLKPTANSTDATWTMTGTNTFLFKAVGLFVDCDKMVGDQFEKGLATLKMVSEAAAKGQP